MWELSVPLSHDVLMQLVGVWVGLTLRVSKARARGVWTAWDGWWEGRERLRGSVSICSGCHHSPPWAGGLDSRHLFLVVLEAGRPRWRCCQGWFLVRPPILVCRWPPASVLPRAVWCLFLIEGQQSQGIMAALMTSFNLIIPSRPHVQYRHMAGVRASTQEFWRQVSQ